MIFDAHCHILPGVDDGAKNETETKRMLEIAFREGIDAIIATPHYEYGMDREAYNQRRKAFERTCQWAKEIKPDARIYLGNEIFYSGSVVQALRDGLTATINGTRYILVEFSIYSEFPYIRNAIYNLRYAGYIPIIAHVERYHQIYKVEYIYELVAAGAYMQANAATVLGNHGWKERCFVMKLMKRRLIHFIGTDAHGSNQRRPEMKNCIEYIKRKLGEDYCYKITEENPLKIIKGEMISE